MVYLPTFAIHGSSGNGHGLKSWKFSNFPKLPWVDGPGAREATAWSLLLSAERLAMKEQQVVGHRGGKGRRVGLGVIGGL